MTWRCKFANACLVGAWLGLLLVVPSWAQTDTRTSKLADARISGTHFLSPTMQALQADASRNPAGLWIERGLALWQAQCTSCHDAIASMKSNVTTFPKLSASKQLVNLEDYIESHSKTKIVASDVLALSAALHDAAKGEHINVSAVVPYYQNGERLWNTRMGRINLACAHCHDQKVGSNMRGDVISQGHPTGFPIYRQSWQTVGSLDRRLRACYSGVQAPVPPTGAPELRDLELFLKVRANGMTIDGPSIRR